MAKKNSKAVKRSNKSFILTLATIAILGYFVISLVSLQFQISEKSKEVETAQQTLASAQAENDEYVLPGESVYYDVSTAN